MAHQYYGRIIGVIVLALLFVDAGRAEVASDPFIDVPAQHQLAAPVAWLHDEGIARGYADGTFRPTKRVTRAEFMKIVVLIYLKEKPQHCTQGSPFPDVLLDAWFAPYICAAKDMGLVVGNPDGSFHPGERISLAEAARMLTAAEGMQVGNATPWYRTAVVALAERAAIPVSVGSAQEQLTRGEVAEIVWRLRKGITDRSSADGVALVDVQCTWLHDEQPPGVDIDEVRRMWLQWNNDTRRDLAVEPYEMDRQLERTALLWSQRARAAGAITHKRTATAGYYDYAAIEEWFGDLGLQFENIDRTTFTENIGWGTYRCGDDDCTGALIKAIRTTYDYFLAERTKEYRPHYNSLVKPAFRRIGLGVAVDPVAGRYYLTVHYGTRITSEPAPVCP